MTSPQYDEMGLVRDLQAGKSEAFRLLLERYDRRVYNLAYRMLDGRRDDAEDATQETFVEVYRSIRGFAGKSSFDTWIHRITVNVCLQRRRRKRLDTVELTAVHAETLPDGCAPPDGEAERSELQRILAEAVATLPEGQREAVLLHGMQGLTHSEVAEALGCPVGTVKSRLFSAFKRLRQVLDGKHEDLTATPRPERATPHGVN